MKYRREIDGLRALAVVPVILFHGGFEAFSGGFVGVDVFFVISGYLITSIIVAELDQKSFSIIDFYDRRARRILPALFLVMLVCIPFAWVWLLPHDFKDFSQSLVAVSAFSSNILFWSESGYFSTAAELKPLLHTWSLAVEEQYYVLFPLFLLFLWHIGRRWIFVGLVFIGAGSLALAELAVHFRPSFAFFMLPTRAWELMAGGLAAIYFSSGKGRRHWIGQHDRLNDLLGWIGLLLIGYAIFAFDGSVPFPGVYALVPTIGTTLIIVFVSQSTSVGKLLGSRILVGIGLISYSAYLWHQPLFAFARHNSLTEPHAWIFASLSLVAMIFAYVSWRFVEKPFRERGVLTRKAVFAFAVSGTFLFSAFGIAGHLTAGFDFRFPQDLMAQLRGAAKTEAKCLDVDSHLTMPAGTCVLIDRPERQVAVIGDSHAGTLDEAVADQLAGQGFGVFSRIHNACPPIEGLYRIDRANPQKCGEYNSSTWRQVESSKSIEYVVLAARWALNLESSRFNNGEGGQEPGGNAVLGIFDGDELKSIPYSDIQEFYKSKVEAVLGLGKKVILVYPIPEMGWGVPNYIGRWVVKTDEDYAIDPSVASTSYSVFVERNHGVYEAFDSIEDHANLARVYPGKLFCNVHIDGRCAAHIDGAILYSDDDHLSASGAEIVAREITRSIRLLQPN